MGRLRRFYNKILAFLGPRKAARPEDIPHLLDKTSLEQALSEARFLRSQFAVEVRELEAGEEAGMPRPAGDFELPQKN